MRSNQRLTLALAAALAATAIGSTTHAAIVYSTDVTTPASIPGLSSFSTEGNEMTGLRVRAVFTGGTDETRVWLPTGANSGGVTGTGWRLDQIGDTFTQPWLFTMSAGLGQLLRLTLDGSLGLTIFDRTEPSMGTPGSAQGRDFEFFGGTCASCDAVVTYRQPTQIGGDAAVGDLWQVVDILFADDGDPTGPRETWQFRQDTDNDIRRDVPTPATLPLLAGAIGAVFALRHRVTRA
ncbi:MAG: hypothetical protein FJX57_09130 [Alphaproteobacteria bacterium]|nr:hypothetical protein [Alphaproteobacteria bacterium]